MKFKVFCGGTCADSYWRSDLFNSIDPELKTLCFDPVVADWTPECQEIERKVKEIVPIHLYVLTPRQIGTFTIHELTMSTIFHKKNVISYIINEKGCCYYDDDLPLEWTIGRLKSLKAQHDELTQFSNYINLNSDWEELEPYSISIEYLARYLEQCLTQKH